MRRELAQVQGLPIQVHPSSTRVQVESLVSSRVGKPYRELLELTVFWVFSPPLQSPSPKFHQVCGKTQISGKSSQERLLVDEWDAKPLTDGSRVSPNLIHWIHHQIPLNWVDPIMIEIQSMDTYRYYMLLSYNHNPWNHMVGYPISAPIPLESPQLVWL